MKISKILGSINTRKSILKTIEMRNNNYSNNVVINDNVNNLEKSIINANKISLGKCAVKNGVDIEFEPLKSDLFAKTRMNIYKTNMEYESDLIYSIFKLKLASFPIDFTLKNSKEKVDILKKVIKKVASNTKVTLKDIKDKKYVSSFIFPA